MNNSKPLVLIIMDGWGWREDRDNNAIAQANTPNWNTIISRYPHTTLNAHGLAVGLPEGVMGNSEVGHLNIGAGRVVMQDITRINKSITDKKFFKNKAFEGCFEKVKKSKDTLHLIGLLSDAGVHSQIDHLFALLDFAKKKKVSKICIHCLTDGRDTSPTSGKKYIAQLEEKIKELDEDYRIATIVGRYFAMDRDKRWDRVKKAYDAIVSGVGRNMPSASVAMIEAYKNGETDEFIEPSIILDKNNQEPTMKDGDAVIFFNFRSDRARQIVRAMSFKEFDKFERLSVPVFSDFVTMTEYESDFNFPVAFSPESSKNIFGEILSNNNLRQLRIAETEKYAHVTYFFDGGNEEGFNGTDKVLIPSPRDVATYDQKPEMSAFVVTDEVLKRIDSNLYDVIIMNYANADMVGHSGNIEAAIKAAETVDKCIGVVVNEALKRGGEVFLTADHGNSEEMIDKDGGPHTSHTLNPVPFVYVAKDANMCKLIDGGRLSDIAPTMLSLLNIKKPKEMTGRSLLEKK